MNLGFLLLLLAFECASAQTLVRGSLLGSDGLPMKSAHLVLHVSSIADSSVVIAADTAGRFSLDAQPGGYMLQAFGLHHKPLTMPLIVTKEPVQLDIWLGAHQLKASLEDIRVIGDFNDFDPGQGAIPLERSESHFYATVLSSADTLAYQVIGALDRPEPYLPADVPWRLAGSDAEDYHFDFDGPRRRFESNYVSVVESPDGRAEITFDPTSIPRTQNVQPVVSSDPAKIAELAKLYGETEARFAAVSKFLRASRSEADNVAQARRRAAAVKWYVDPFVTRAKSESDHLVRSWLLVAYFDDFSQFQEDRGDEMLQVLLDTVEPTSPVWSIRAYFNFGVSNVIARMGMAAEDDTALSNRLAEYVEALAREHSDMDVRAQALYIGTSPLVRGDDEALMWSYYRKLVTEYPHTRYAEDVRRRYSPERRIQNGERVPAFEFVSLADSNRIYSDKALRGSVYLIDFWGTWCGPCIEEMPYLHRAYEEFQSKGFSILSVAFEDTRETIKIFRADRYPMPWMHSIVAENDGASVKDRFELTGFPRPVLVDEHGIIVATNEELRGDALIPTLRRFVER